MLKRWQLALLACPVCKSKLVPQKTHLVCKKCSREYSFKSDFPILIPDLTEDTKLTMEKWDQLYAHKLKIGEYIKDMMGYQADHQPAIVEQVNEIYQPKKGNVYLEIGCGPAYLGLYYGKKGVTIVGIDISISALKIAQKLARQYRIKNTLFVCGDITQMPFATGVFNIVYGGGVIEHFRATQAVVSDSYRILKKKGVSFNSVPCLNIGTIYRFKWGNIPNIPVVRQIAEFINLQLLGGRHMTFGYELSFLRSTLISLHAKAGFAAKKIQVGKYRTIILLERIGNIWLRKLFTYLCSENELFWPMYKVIAVK